MGSKNARIPLGVPGFFLADLPAAPKRVRRSTTDNSIEKTFLVMETSIGFTAFKGWWCSSNSKEEAPSFN